MTAWEYRVETIASRYPDREDTIDHLDKSIQDGLNGAGKDGWELVAVVQMDTNRFRAFFKRPAAVEPKRQAGFRT